MNSERWQQVRSIFEGALALEEDERGSYLAKSCTADSELRREVESLLHHHQRAGSGFMETPAFDLTTGAMPVSRTGRRIGVYQIVAEIGRGGMGEVYRASRADGLYEKQVALKLVRGGFDSDFVVARFRNERQILASLDHPNIARLLDGGTTEDGVPYLVMELVEGETIDAYCRKRLLSISQRLRLFCEVCSAVHYAHQRLVIHRDLKPSNILVTHDGMPKLLDFGIAKILDPLAGGETTLVRPMTPEYASPEQVQGEPITTASDVYSLGILLYQLLTQTSPYADAARSPHELARAILEVNPTRPSSVVETDPEVADGGSLSRLRRRLAGDLDTIVLKAIRKEPDRRYGSVQQLADDITRHLQQLPVAARPDSWAYRAGKFVRRHRLAVAAVGLVGVTLFGGVAATLREARIAHLERARAEKRFQDVRKLANSLIFDINDAVQYLPGSSSANKLIVEKSLEYLDSLAQESGGDISLQRELATAYGKVAQVQGYPFGQNLGDPNGALRSFRKSLAIREGVLRSDPNSIPDQLAIAALYRFIGLTEWVAAGNTEDATNNLARAIVIAEGVRRRAPDNLVAVQELGADYLRAGDIQSGSGTGTQGTSNIELGLEYHEKSLPLFKQVAEATPENPRKQYPLAAAELSLGENLIKLDKLAEALEHIQKGCLILRPYAANPNNTLFRSGMDSCYSQTGEIRMRQGRYVEAAAVFRSELQSVEDLAVSDPNDRDMQVRRAFAQADLGYALVRSGRTAEGWKLLKTAWNTTQKWTADASSAELRDARASIGMSFADAAARMGHIRTAVDYYIDILANYREIAESDPKNVGAKLGVAMTHVEMGALFVRLNDIERAAREYDQARVIADLRLSQAPQDRTALYASATACAGLGDIASIQWKTGIFSLRSDAQVQARSWYEKSVATFFKLHSFSTTSPNGFPGRDIRDVRRRLAQLH
jgi:eukaryotic-like serine/threonine-protein kinase